MVGCAGTPLPVTTIHEDPRSAVFLQTISDRSYEATHPIKLEETILADVLRGVHTEEKADFTLLIGKALKASQQIGNRRAFLEDDIALLAPYLTVALAKAAPNQRVGFRLYSPSGKPTPPQKGGPETTEGYLFAQGQSLHFTLTLYHYMPGGPSKPYMVAREPRPLPDSNGLRDLEVKFLPEIALLQESDGGSGLWFGKSEHQTLVIDYQLLAKLMALPPEPAHTAAPPTMPGPAPKSDPELQTLKEEMKALQKKMDEQSAELQKLKKSPQKKQSSP